MNQQGVPIVLDNIVFSLQRSGGASVYWKQILQGVLEDGLFSPTLLERSDAADNITRHAMSYPNTAQVIARDYVPRRIAQFSDVASPVDHALFHSSCYRVSRTRGVANITTVHDFIWQRYTTGLNRSIHMGQIAHAIKQSESIICVSESTKRDMFEFVPESKGKEVRVIPHSYDAESYRFRRMTRKQQVAFIGARTQYKNFDVAVKAVAFLDDIELVVIGAALSEKETSMLDALIPGRWKALVFPSSEQVSIEFNQSIALLYLSDYEGFGIPVLEGMASGVPVVALNKSSIPEVAGNAGVLLEQADAREVADVVKTLVSDTASFDKVVAKGLARASMFSWERCLKMTKSCYLDTFNKYFG